MSSAPLIYVGKKISCLVQRRDTDIKGILKIGIQK